MQEQYNDSIEVLLKTTTLKEKVKQGIDCLAFGYFCGGGSRLLFGENANTIKIQNIVYIPSLAMGILSEMGISIKNPGLTGTLINSETFCLGYIAGVISAEYGINLMR